MARGFDAAVMRDPWDNIAEFAFANLWVVKGGVALTPTDNKTFLAGITRRRVMALLNEQPQLQRVLQLVQALAQRRLAEAERGGGLQQAAMGLDGVHRAQQMQPQPLVEIAPARHVRSSGRRQIGLDTQRAGGVGRHHLADFIVAVAQPDA